VSHNAGFICENFDLELIFMPHSRVMPIEVATRDLDNYDLLTS